jgi:diaminopimelate decarboxylase
MSRPLDFFSYVNGNLAAEGVSVEKVADAVGTPVYIYSAKAFLSPLRELQAELRGMEYLICFAAKSNSNIAILKLLRDAGAGVDLVSGGELHRAGIAGFPADRVVFSGVGKTPGEMARALEYDGSGIFSFNVESVAELEVLNAVAAELGRKAPVALRFNPDVDAKTHPYISTGLKKNKFGLERSEILAIAGDLGRFPHISLQGISIHIGSQLLSLSPLRDAFGRLAKLVRQINAITGKELKFVDLGGGIGISYGKEKSPDLRRYGALIRKHFGPGSGNPIKVVLEPGRSISGNSGILVSEVLYRKERRNKDFLVIDAAMNDLMRPSLYGSYHEIVPVKQAKTRLKKRRMDIVGPICETADCFGTDRALPSTLNRGDLVAILSAGAYGFSMSSNYNARPRPPEVLVQEGGFKVIRDRENYDDLVRGEHL